jgi:xylose dehydrogenase (NAD/NADP)
MPDKIARWGLLSTARINERLIPAIRAAARSELLAVCSRSQEKAESYQANWEIPRAYGSYDDMLADPDVNVVHISLPNSMHREWAVKSAEAGKHILCEKPLAQTADDVDAMAQAAQRNVVVLQEATMMRFHPQTLKLQALLADGIIGDVRLIRGVMCCQLAREHDIRLKAELGGGSLWDLGSYCVNFMRTMMQANPVEVSGWHVPHDSGVDTSFWGQIRFASGTVGQFFSSFQAMPRFEADLIGSDGMIQLDCPWVNNVGVTSNVRIFRRETSEKKSTFSEDIRYRTMQVLSCENINAYQDEVNSMVNTVCDGADPVISTADSRDNAATLDALCRSAQKGRPVKV